MQKIKLIECPRDAMQGWNKMIPTEKKVAYINQLLKVGFDTIDFGSFVSQRAIPQMADTKEVITQLSLENTPTQLLAIVANERGAREASEYNAISYLGFPFSVSPTFQKRNTNSTLEQSLETVKAIQTICIQSNKKPVVYISMAFGNPYGDACDEQLVMDWIARLKAEGIGIISLADTVGLAQPSQVGSLVSKTIQAFPEVETGVHLHSTRLHWQQKVDAAYQAGCRRFDGALLGVGGCPMAKDELVGNMDTSLMVEFFSKQKLCPNINREELQKSITMAGKIFS